MKKVFAVWCTGQTLSSIDFELESVAQQAVDRFYLFNTKIGKVVTAYGDKSVFLRQISADFALRDIPRIGDMYYLIGGKLLLGVGRSGSYFNLCDL